jgi:antitoxin component YwqK of YwqJK toxin-antitoxin module
MSIGIDYNSMLTINPEYKKMFKLKTAITLFLLFFGLVLYSQHKVELTNGNEYSEVNNLKDAEDFYLFDKDGKSYSVSKHRIQRITDMKGNVIYEKQELIAQIAPDETSEYIFYKNEEEVGKGEWLDAGRFEVTEGDIPDGLYKEFHDTGEVKRTFSFVGGTLNGVCRVYYRSGKVEREGFFKNGVEEGESKLFYPNGNLKGISYFQKGFKNGPTKLYYESNKVKALMRFKNGKPDGEQVMLYENGKPESKVIYDEGIKNGIVEFFYESGKLKLQGKYVNGFLDGTVTTYYESGRVKNRKIYRNGRILQR